MCELVVTCALFWSGVTPGLPRFPTSVHWICIVGLVSRFWPIANVEHNADTGGVGHPVYRRDGQIVAQGIGRSGWRWIIHFILRCRTLSWSTRLLCWGASGVADKIDGLHPASALSDLGRPVEPLCASLAHVEQAHSRLSCARRLTRHARFSTVSQARITFFRVHRAFSAFLRPRATDAETLVQEFHRRANMLPPRCVPFPSPAPMYQAHTPQSEGAFERFLCETRIAISVRTSWEIHLSRHAHDSRIA